ncbi:nitric oxide-sensing protein NosP [Niveispirillum sp.]|uniref:nitric oxide-sensing protein NosP n=1 Tax=Niveispirillum sp. TaxID=1917217 RepID=UPI001B4E1991|nr:nitric oxide-sensing protein NosP [Niveispirillum sp.]MBP7338647.1 FIST C-terminal domain-containing protein [Niveispirillum sp.]
MPPIPSRSLVRACTYLADPAAAIDELHSSLAAADPALIVLFCSSHYDLPAVAASLRARFPGVPAVGCTTSGELTPLGYMDGSITAVAFPKGDFAATVARFDHVSRFEIGDAKPKVRELLAEAEDTAIEMGPDARHVALFLVDGLCVKEELIISALHDALGGLPLIGGSAGDDMRFEATHVLHDGEFRVDAGVLLILTTTRPFKVFRNQHFVHTDQKMVVTQADPTRRIVTEINAEPAAREYARMVGLEGEPLTPMIFASYPVVVRVGGEYYVRSIQKVNEDESLTFFCAIDEGIVLTVATGVDIVRNLQELFDGLTAEIGKPDLILGFDCVFRSLELEQKQLKQAASKVLASQNVVGFCTYGEQYNAMHVNQTFTGLAIGAR